MNIHKVLITTSGVGSRLGEITKYVNKAIVRIGKRGAISYILDNVPKEIPIVITLGYKKEIVKQYLSLAHPDRIFEFVEVDNYDGLGSSLAYSMLCAKNHLDCPFTFIANDSLFSSTITFPKTNWLGVAKSCNGAEYMTIDANGEAVLRINPKGEVTYDYIYIGLAGINEHKNFWKELEKLYRKDPNNTSLNDGLAIAEMIKKGSTFQIKEFPDWKDVGNIAALKEARKNVKDSFDNLEKLDESIYIFEPNYVVKFFNDSKIISNRITRAKQLKAVVPEIEAVTENFYRYRYTEGQLFSFSVNPTNFPIFLEWSKKKLWEKVNLKEEQKKLFEQKCYKFYHDKTINRLKKFYESTGIVDKETNINNQGQPKLAMLLDQIDWNNLSEGNPSIFHGDLHFENIIELKNGNFCLLDWRQDFDGSLDCGDIYYDLAKLNHGMIISHEIIRKELFKILREKEKIICEIMRTDTLAVCQQQFFQFLKENDFDVRKTDILTSLIFLNIAPLHHYPYNLFLYFFGKYRLWLTLNHKYNPEGMFTRAKTQLF